VQCGLLRDLHAYDARVVISCHLLRVWHFKQGGGKAWRLGVLAIAGLTHARELTLAWRLANVAALALVNARLVRVLALLV